MLKQLDQSKSLLHTQAAAFGRLCVETNKALSILAVCSAAAFGRLCVETISEPLEFELAVQPPSGGCVLKHG